MTAFLLHLLRHGAPALPGRLMGRTDCPATAEGIAACIKQVEGLSFDRLISSDLVRCADAARAIGAATIDPRWRELDFGEWDGVAASEVDAAAIGAFWDDPDANPPPGGERWSSLVERVGEAIRELAPVDTLVVTHGGAMRAALLDLCGFQQKDLWAFDLPYAALLTLKIWPGERPTAQIVGLS
ncbi:hypothetical protein ACFB49_04650 [Sphingomonas sp. DBB INV C78]|uniref:histidine phosphatase family protein n=1 Tax=Sphingomonas sp. DBB INV C78 TaxID=3349434 RepID=UPI0036D28BAE